MSAQSPNFPHHRLDAWNVALEMASQARRVADAVPRGFRRLADQLMRAAGSTALLIAEGANRWSLGQKRQRYSEARGECGEVAAAAELLGTLGLVHASLIVPLLELASRVGAMLKRLLIGLCNRKR